MNKELVIKYLNRFRQLLEEDKATCLEMKKKFDAELSQLDNLRVDLDNIIESHTKNIKELEEIVLAIGLS
ncbi:MULTISPECIES: hypothetical protein [Chryseobacterium]|uniref:Uncharacterized protein n=1 Tax=Chryseobacterium endophyticum TaxID=1854762 RepID=A0AAU6WSK4_9FLAO|nr:hypothetical protein [uncultured Chryseobacterium sp.]